MGQAELANLGFSPQRFERVRTAMKRYVDEGKIAGVVTLVARYGKIAQMDCLGMSDIEAHRAIERNTIFRIASMTKPITAAAVMLLVEEGRLRLDSPLSDYLPAFKDVKVAIQKDDSPVELVDPARPVTIRDLLTHTAGYSYGWNPESYADRQIREIINAIGEPDWEITAHEYASAAARVPLAHQPGQAFTYGISYEILGSLIEAVSGLPFRDFLQQRIFAPLGMVDTGFTVPLENASRFITLYEYNPDAEKPGNGTLVNRGPGDTSRYFNRKHLPSGGGGLVSTAEDYFRFCQMILNGGNLDGVQVLGRKTVELMRTDHLAEGKKITDLPVGGIWGYGLGAGIAPASAALQNYPLSVGTLCWGGAYNTMFYIDFQEQLILILMANYLPMVYFKIVEDFKTSVYQALV